MLSVLATASEIEPSTDAMIFPAASLSATKSLISLTVGEEPATELTVMLTVVPKSIVPAPCAVRAVFKSA